MMRRAATWTVVAMALLALPSARAATTNDAPMEALLAVADNDATTTTNGWTLYHIGSYDSDSVLQFNSKDDWILSPDFGAPILRMEFSVRCTANTARRMAVFNETTGGQIREFALCAKGNTDEPQVFDFTPDEALTQFRLKMNAPSNSSGYWGIGDLKIVFDFDAPADLRVYRKGGDWCGLSWENGEGTVSNRVDTFLVERNEEGETVLLSTGFDKFRGNDSQTVDYSEKLSEMSPAVADGISPEFSGEKVYAAAGTNGICQIGTTSRKGFLVYAGLPDYSGVKLRMRLMRFQYVEDSRKMNVAYEKEGKTVVLEVDLPDEFEERVVDLSSVPGNEPLIIGYYDRVGGNRRVLIDSLEFVRNGTETKTLVDSRWIPADSGAASFSTKGYGIELLPKSEYRFEVRSKTAGVLVSDPAAVDVVLDSPPGFRFILR